MILCKLFSLWIFLFISMPIIAGTFIGNGGEGVLEEERFLLLDFFENGIREDNVDCGQQIDRNVSLLKITRSLSLSKEDQACLSKAVLELEKISETLKPVFIQVANLYRWSLVEGEMKSSPVSSAYQDGKIPLKTLAIRHLDGIRISKIAWNKMAALDRAGLVVHEVLYSILRPNCRTMKGRSVCSQDSLLVRNFTSQLFSEVFRPESLRKLWLAEIYGDGIGDDFPVETLKPSFYEYWDKEGSRQYGVFIQRDCERAIDVSECRNQSREPMVRAIYERILKRPVTDSEVYWWVHHSIYHKLDCHEVMSLFFKSPEYLSQDNQSSEDFSSEKICSRL